MPGALGSTLTLADLLVAIGNPFLFLGLRLLISNAGLISSQGSFWYQDFGLLLVSCQVLGLYFKSLVLKLFVLGPIKTIKNYILKKNTCKNLFIAYVG